MSSTFPRPQFHWTPLAAPQEEAWRAPHTTWGMLKLWGWVEKEWEAIPQSVCRDLVESMSMKVAAVIEAKGTTQSTDNLTQLYSIASATKLFQCCLPDVASISLWIPIVTMWWIYPQRCKDFLWNLDHVILMSICWDMATQMQSEQTLKQLLTV